MKKVLGLILELNPYHNGHEYFINEAINNIKPDLTIAIISSSFMMRGDVMVMDKFYKTKLLLDNNIDIILELPFLLGVNSSDLFTKASVNILKEFNVTDICFGGEADNLDILNKLNELTSSSEFNLEVKNNLNKGYSYTTSNINALKQVTNDENLIKNYSLPNNTLGLGYLKAIKNTKIIPHLIKRQCNNYYDENLSNLDYSSATSIRNELDKGNNIDSLIPNYNYSFYKPNILNNKLYYLLQYNLINNKNITNIKGISEGIENRLLNFINEPDYDSFINKVQTKRYTKNKIKRLILYILLNIDKSFENYYLPYKRVLGMSELGKKHLNSLDKDIKKEIITTFKNNNQENKYYDIIEAELNASKLYGLLINDNNFYLNEFNIPYKKGLK